MSEQDETIQGTNASEQERTIQREKTRGQEPLLSTFVETRQYQRFVEGCQTCRQHRFIGVCYGEAGVGKTRSARRFTQWDQMERQLAGESIKEGEEGKGDGKIAFYTPGTLMSPKRLEQEVLHLHVQMGRLSSLTPPLMQTQGVPRGGYRVTELNWDLLVIDESDRVKPMGLEVLRDLYDRSQMGLMLIGMPGIEKRLARYPQFFSRVGFVHEFCALSAEELREILQQQVYLVDNPGEEDLPATEALDEEALAAIIRMTGGNFRLIHRLLTQVERILRINHLSKVTKAVVEAARSSLVFGREG
ncbi:AAA family ATPase [Dictyobacter arantiisoli]|uniref:ATP-binding protein n=1 Tax=Dictyobacter arantiisoli TaxID=2014874 RepID=A0A5A5TIH0_9CHLR|nr:AAA family ATPase [Dictyobacter arantiisoli]GCF11400.1 ATP-binding protein [Dictyobacter arantiisoli]